MKTYSSRGVPSWRARTRGTGGTADAAFEAIAPQQAYAEVWRIVEALNGYITEQEPWKVAKDDGRRDRLATILNTAAEGLRALAVLLNPVTPKACAALWTSLGAEPSLGALGEQRIGEGEAS